ncbi:MAG: hypothetical protein V3Q69_06395 [Burkholderia sp.]
MGGWTSLVRKPFVSPEIARRCIASSRSIYATTLFMAQKTGWHPAR